MMKDADAVAVSPRQGRLSQLEARTSTTIRREKSENKAWAFLGALGGLGGSHRELMRASLHQANHFFSSHRQRELPRLDGVTFAASRANPRVE